MDSTISRLIKISERKQATVNNRFRRYLFDKIDWNQRLIIILGQRGTGKTTIMFQRMSDEESISVYLSLDDIYFEANRLIYLVDALYEQGYRSFFLDEVHRYQYWSADIKSMFDNYPDIHIVVTGSSILEISRGTADLSRRAAEYTLAGLSFREFLELQYEIRFQPIALETVLNNHTKIASTYTDEIDILKTFKEYLSYGYYPFFNEGIEVFNQKLGRVMNTILDTDILSFEDITYETVRNMKKLLFVISQSVPFKPNISSLSKKMEIPRNSILKMLDMLNRAELIYLLRSYTKGVSYLQKPDKIYLQNTNQHYALSGNAPETGTIRETFFVNQLRVNHLVTSAKWGDIMVDETYTFEIGGPSKTGEQIKGVPNAWIASDDIKGGSGKKVPIWLFGFLY